MKRLLFLFLPITLFSCGEDDTVPFEHQQQDADIVTDRSGRQYPFLDPNVLSYCGSGWGRKFCRFLHKYDGTVWANAENYYGDFSDIKFSNFSHDDYFVSFFTLDSIASYCEGWKMGETTYNGMKWNIKIKKDQEDVFWFDYDYYGRNEEIEYTITYKYEVIDGLLNFSSSEGQTFIFTPSEKNYSEEVVEIGEIIRLEGCIF
ncbi:MAG: hypothetical protein AAF960_20300 [Bacteroidota bacterium]